MSGPDSAFIARARGSVAEDRRLGELKNSIAASVRVEKLTLVLLAECQLGFRCFPQWTVKDPRLAPLASENSSPDGARCEETETYLYPPFPT